MTQAIATYRIKRFASKVLVASFFILGSTALTHAAPMQQNIKMGKESRNVIERSEVLTIDSIAAAEAKANNHLIRESFFPDGSRSLSVSHFTWGAEIGASVDLTGNDLSTFDIDAIFGYKNSWIRTVGVGAGIHRSFGNGNTFIPIYAVFRSSFRSKPSLVFLNTKLGYSFNTLHGTNTKGGFKGSVGVGFNLAMSRRFQSHLILSMGYFRLDGGQALAAGLTVHNVFLAQVSFGMNF